MKRVHVDTVTDGYSGTKIDRNTRALQNYGSRHKNRNTDNKPALLQKNKTQLILIEDRMKSCKGRNLLKS